MKPKFNRLLAASITSVLALSSSAFAANFYWDDGTLVINGASDGGTGAWTGGAAGWEDGTAAQNWADGNDAFLGGTAGTVTLGGAISATSITLNTTGYIIAKGGNNLTIGSLSGTGAVTISGTGTTAITGSSAGYSGAITLGPGSDVGTTDIVTIGASDSLGTGILNARGAQIQYNGAGTLTIANAISNGAGGFRTGGTGNLTFTGGMTFDQTRTIANYGTGLLTLGGPLTVTAGQLASFDGGVISVTGNVTGAGGIQLTSAVSTPDVTLSGSNNNYTGATTVSAGALKINGTVNGTSSIILTGNDSTLSVATGGSLTSAGSFTLQGGSAAGGVFNQTDGVTNLTTTTENAIVIGGTNNTFGKLNISGGTFNAKGVTTQLTFFGSVTGALNVSDSGTANFLGINMNASASGNGTLNLSSGGTLNIGTGGITNTGAGSSTINLGAGTVGAFSGNWSSPVNMALTSAGTGTTFNTADSDTSAARNITLSGVLSGSGSLVKSGAGTLLLSGINTYTGTTTINGGVLEIATGKSIATGTGITIEGASGTLGAAYPFNDQIRQGTLYLRDDSGSPGSDQIGSQTVTMKNGTVLWYSGGGLDSTTIQNIALASGANTITVASNGGTDILKITNLTRAAGATVEFRSAYAPLGTGEGRINVTNLDGSLIANTNGILGGWAFVAANTTNNVYSGTANSFARWDSGTSSIVAATPDQQTSSTAISTGTATENWLVNGGGGGNTLTADKTINSLITQSDLIINSGATLTLASGGLILRDANHWIKSTSGSGNITSGTNDLYLQSGGGSDQRVRVKIVDGAAGALTVRKSGSGTVVFTEANTYTGSTIVNAGTITIGNNIAFGAFQTGRPVTQVVVNSGGAVDFGGVADATYGYTIAGSGMGGTGALTNSGGAIGNNSAQASNITLSADASIGGATTRDWALLANSWNATTLDLNGKTLTKTGANTISLVSTTTTAGNVRISNGIMALGATIGGSGVTGSTSAFSLDNTAGATLSVIKNSSVGSLAGGGATGGNVILAGSTALTVGALNTSTTYGGVINGAGTLGKTGTGRLTLTGANTYPGGTAINGGTVSVSTIADSGSSNLGTFNGTTGYIGLNTGTLEYTGTSSSTTARLLWVNQGSGTFDITEAGGTLSFTGTPTSVMNQAITKKGAGTLNLSRVISGAGSVTVEAGTMALTGSNTYSGTTAVDAGKLVIDGNQSSATGAVSVASGATLAGIGTVGGTTTISGKHDS